MKFMATVVAAGIGVGAVGCAAEAPPESTDIKVVESISTPQTWKCFFPGMWTSCYEATPGSNANNPNSSDQVAQGHTRILFSALLAGDLHGIPNDGSIQCNVLRYYLSYLESTVAQGYATFTNMGNQSVLGLPATVYNYNYSYPGADNTICSAMGGLTAAADDCFQDQWMDDFIYPPGTSSCSNSPTLSTANMNFDPEPAQLTQPLSSYRGSSAAATDTATNAAVTAWQWPSSPSTGGVFAGGEPCSSVALSAGQSTSANIQKSGSSLQYSACK